MEVEDAQQAAELVDALRAAGEPLVHAYILHEGRLCNAARCVCSPSYVLERLDEETLLEGAREQEAWIRETAEAEA